MEIQVGEYIRTKDGVIAKVTSKDEDNHLIIDRYYDGAEYLTNFDIKENIKSHSLNIIDLIEEGDYVNGLEVVTIDGYDDDGNDKEELGILETYVDEVDGIYLTDVNIKSIVTHEQMEAMEYEVK